MNQCRGFLGVGTYVEVWGVAQRSSCLRGMTVVACRDAGFPKRYQRGSLVVVWVLFSLQTKNVWHFKVAKPKQGVWLSPLDSSFHRFPGAQIFIYKRLLISSSRKALRWRDSRKSQRGPCASDTQLDSESVVSTPIDKTEIQCESRTCANAVSAHTRHPLTQMTSWYKPDLTYGIQ